jgi:type 1 glutamine amidotransferase
MNRRTFSLALAASIGTLLFPAQSLEAAPKKLLVVTITTGFRHGPAIQEAEKVLPTLAEKSAGEFSLEFLSEPGPKPGVGKAPERGKTMTDAEWAEAQETYKKASTVARAAEAEWMAKVKALFAEKFSAQGLKQYDGVVFCNTTGELPLPDGEAFAAWIKSGKAFVGMHAATDTLKAMPAYYEMINGSFAGHPWGSGGSYEFVNHEPSHPAAAMFPASFQWKDEIYQYNNFNPESVRVLVSLDTLRSSPRAPYHVPVSWVRDVGSGRLFYTNLGHNAGTWQDETYQKHVVEGIRWALKLVDGPSKANPEISAQHAVTTFVGLAAELSGKDAAALQAKALAKAKANPEWANKTANDANALRKIPGFPIKQGAKLDDSDPANAKRVEIATQILSEVEK